jgi:predicted kinase
LVATIHFLVGPVGAGKSTFARRRCARSAALFVDVDTWMVRLFGADPRPAENVMAWYLERRARVRELAWDVAVEAVAAAADVYLELGLVTAVERATWFEKAQAADLAFTVTLLDAPREVRRERVAQRNVAGAPHTQVVPTAFFEAASDAWQPVDEDERRRWGITDA